MKSDLSDDLLIEQEVLQLQLQLFTSENKDLNCKIKEHKDFTV